MEQSILPSMIRRSTARTQGTDEERQVRTHVDAGPGSAPTTFPQKPSVLSEKPHFEEQPASVEPISDKKLQKKLKKLEKEKKKMKEAKEGEKKGEEEEKLEQEQTQPEESKFKPQFDRISRREYVTEIQEVTIPIRTVIVEEPPYQVTLPPKHMHDDGDIEELTKDMSSTRVLSPKTLDPVEKKIVIKRKLFVQPIVHHTLEATEVESKTQGETKQIIEGPCFTLLPPEERWLPNLYEQRHEFVQDKLEIEKQVFLTKIDKMNLEILEPTHQRLDKPRGTEKLPGMFISSSEDEMYTATVKRTETAPAKTKSHPQKEQHVERQSQQAPTETATSIEQMSSSETEPPHGITLSDIAS